MAEGQKCHDRLQINYIASYTTTVRLHHQCLCSSGEGRVTRDLGSHDPTGSQATIFIDVWGQDPPQMGKTWFWGI